MSGKKGMKDYSLSVKLQAVRMFLEEGKTKTEIRETLGLTKGRVKVWVTLYRAEGEAGLQKKRGCPQRQEESVEEELARLRMENELLKKFPAELRKDALAKRNIGLLSDTKRDLK
jgi:transposase